MASHHRTGAFQPAGAGGGCRCKGRRDILSEVRLATLFLVCAAIGCAQPGSIEGTAVNQSGGQPMEGVHVRWMAGSFDGIHAVYGAISDKAGHFSISSLPPGEYMMTAERTGFFLVAPKSDSARIVSVQIKPGQKVQDFRLEMALRAVLAGRVVDEFGDPVPNITVEAKPGTGDAPVFFNSSLVTNTDDRGEFRVVTTPGKFYVKATPQTMRDEPAETRTDGTTDTAYGPTFYPSAASKERGVAIEAKPGNDVTGLEIHLLRQRTMSISGTVTGIPDHAGPATVYLRYADTAEQAGGTRGALCDAAGRFSFARLPAGRYGLFAIYSSGTHPFQSPTVNVELESAGQTGVELALHAGEELTGTLQVTGLPAEKRSVKLDPVDRYGYFSGPLSAAVDSDGAFQIANVMAGKYRVVVEPLPDNGYVKTVQVDGAAASDGILDLSHGAHGSSAKVVAANGAGQLSGRVRDKDGRPIVNSPSIVFLMADPKLISIGDMTRVSSPDGSYSRSGIRPGKYRLFALDLFRYGDAALQSGDMSALFLRGEEIEIKEGEKIVKDVTVLEKEGADAGKQ